MGQADGTSSTAHYSNTPHAVTLTKPFWIGVFEVTQKQYQLVVGSNPALYKGDKRPVEKLWWSDVRGDGDWPSSKAVAGNSFMGRLRARTGLPFDLPTEAQWEYACRAGTTSKYNNGGNSESDLKKLARYYGNRSNDNLYTMPVGSYLPNAWGLYDMHGNVYEWCLDRFSTPLSAATDPVGPTSGGNRIARGGGYFSHYDCCCSAYRYDSEAYPHDDRGFRAACSAE